MAKYRVRRDLENNEYAQNQATSKADCKALLRSIRNKWMPLRDQEAFGYRFEIEFDANKSLTVEKVLLKDGEEVGRELADRYIIERAN